MIRRFVVGAVLALWALGTSPLLAQRRASVGFGVGVGLLGPMVLTEDDSLNLRAGTGFVVSTALTVGVSRRIGIRVSASRTLGQRFTLSAPAFGVPTLDAGLAATSVGASVLVVPRAHQGGSNAAVLFVEAGGGLLLTTFGSMTVQGTSYTNSEFSTEQLAAVLGVGLSLPLGPRAMLDLTGRVLRATAYDSRGLDLWNGASPPSHVKGRSPMVLQLGAGVRYGRWPQS